MPGRLCSSTFYGAQLFRSALCYLRKAGLLGGIVADVILRSKELPASACSDYPLRLLTSFSCLGRQMRWRS